MAAEDIQTALENIPQEVITVSIFAASAAFHLAQMGVKRYISERAIMMQHRESLSARGNTDQIISLTRMIKSIVDSWVAYESERIGISYKEYKAKIENDWWLYGKEILENNVADEMVQISCSKELSVVTVKTVSTIFGDFTVRSSKCPIL